MSERAPNHMPLQALSQTTKKQNLPLNHFTASGKPIPSNNNLISKHEQENIVPSFPSAQFKPLDKKQPLISISDKDLNRNRVALGQKPISTLNIPSSRTNNVPYHLTHYIPPKATHPQVFPIIPDTTLPANKESKPETQRSGQNVASTQKPISRPSQSQSLQNAIPVYGTQEWINGLVQSLPKYKFYFDGVDPTITSKLSKTLQIYNASISMFFSNEVTHVITTRPIPSKEAIAKMKENQPPAPNVSAGASIPHTAQAPGGRLSKPSGTMQPSNMESIIVKAINFGIHVWSLDRVTKFLAPLMNEPIAPTENHSLRDLLRHEKLNGLATNQISEFHKSAEYHVFKDAFLLVEDTTGHHRAIIAQSYESPESTITRPPWPRIYLQRTERSPFTRHTYQARSKRAEKAKDATVDIGGSKTVNTMATPHDFSLQGGPSAQVSGISRSVTSNIISTNSIAGNGPTTQMLHNVQDKVLEQLGKRTLTGAKGDLGVMPDPKNPEFIRPKYIAKAIKPGTVQEIPPTAAQNTNIITNPNPTPNTKINNSLPTKYSQKTSLISSTQSKSMALPGSVTSAKADTVVTAQNNAESQLNDNKLSGEPNAAITNPAEAEPLAFLSYVKQGYCENCRKLYSDFNKHIDTPEHRKYAQDSTKFARLDLVLSLTQRKLKSQSNTTENTTKDTQPKSKSIIQATTEEISDTVNDTLTEGKCSGDKNDATQFPNIDISSSSTTPPFPPVNCPKDLLEEAATVAKERKEPELEVEHAPEPAPVSEAVLKLDTEVEEKPECEIIEPTCPTESVNCDEDVEPAVKSVEGAKEEDEIEKQLSSELSRLDVSETGEETREKDIEGEYQVNQMVVEQEAVHPANPSEDELETLPQHSFNDQYEASRSDKRFISETNTVQLETDATQPDSRFLGEPSSMGDHRTMDSAAPIRLSISQGDLPTDNTEPVSAQDRDPFERESSSEEDRDGSDDAVALLKSPSAGRGLFSRISNISTSRNLKGLNSYLALPRESFKRKLETAMAEEEEEEEDLSHSRLTTFPFQSSTRPVIYDDNLRSQLVSQQLFHYKQQQQQKGSSRASDQWSPCSRSQASHVQQPMASSSPSQFGIQHTVPQAPFQVQRAQSSTHRTISDMSVPQSWDGDVHGSHLVGNSSHHMENRSSSGSNLSPFIVSDHRKQHYQQSLENSDHNPFTRESKSNTSFSYLNNIELSPSTHLASRERGNIIRTPQSPSEMGYHGFGSSLGSSPIRSPSQRSRQRNYIPVMSHAEEERERHYQHFRGNSLPEPAGGQKKMKSSPGLEEDFEEYGEGCVVFIE